MKTVPTVRLADPADAVVLPDLPEEVGLVMSDIAGRGSNKGSAHKTGDGSLPRHTVDDELCVDPVVEIDGVHHYASDDGRADTRQYAQMVSADR